MAGGGASENAYLALSSLSYGYYRLAQRVAAEPGADPANRWSPGWSAGTRCWPGPTRPAATTPATARPCTRRSRDLHQRSQVRVGCADAARGSPRSATRPRRCCAASTPPPTRWGFAALCSGCSSASSARRNSMRSFAQRMWGAALLDADTYEEVEADRGSICGRRPSWWSRPRPGDRRAAHCRSRPPAWGWLPSQLVLQAAISVARAAGALGRGVGRGPSWWEPRFFRGPETEIGLRRSAAHHGLRLHARSAAGDLGACRRRRRWASRSTSRHGPGCWWPSWSRCVRRSTSRPCARDRHLRHDRGAALPDRVGPGRRAAAPLKTGHSIARICLKLVADPAVASAVVGISTESLPDPRGRCPAPSSRSFLRAPAIVKRCS